MIVDTSVWVEHLRRGVAPLQERLEEGVVLGHPFVIGELACGNLKDRATILGLLAGIPAAVVAEHHEVLELVERRRLFGRGMGWIDMHLLASALVTGAILWTRDQRLSTVAREIGVGI